MRRTKAVQGVAAVAAPFFALARPSSLHALTRSLQAFSTLAAAFAASLAGSTFGGAFGIARTHARRLAEGRARCRSAHPAIRASLSFVSSREETADRVLHFSYYFTAAVAWPWRWSTRPGSRGT